MAKTGLRPNEAKRLQFRDVSIVHDDATDETILEIEVREKRGRVLQEHLGAVCALSSGLAIETRRKRPSSTSSRCRTIPSSPKTHHQLFDTILKEENLKTDREGQVRTAYRLRHTYICLRLMEGADIYQIAKNCRTTVKMIEKYYASYIKTGLDAAAINIRKKKPSGNASKESRK